MSPEQCRAARAWLNWTQQELAAAAKTALSTVKDYEGGKRTPMANNLAAIRAALEGAGIGFLFVADADGTRPCGITYADPARDTTH